ncbi:MAG: EamA family transporter [Planctomycetes bacterium]|nr:EamA family transporter [Planctomycetota bacterium]
MLAIRASRTYFSTQLIQMTSLPERNKPSLFALAAAFAAVYLIWGSTYLGIKFAIVTLPAFAMAGMRFLIAGCLLFTYCLLTGQPKPQPRQWINTTIVGALLLLGGNGCVVWAAQHVPSGIVALLVAVLPMWMVLIEWLRPAGTNPSRGVLIGLVVGFAGVAVLMNPSTSLGNDSIKMVPTLVLLLGGLLWATGSIYSRRAKMPASLLVSTSMQMLAGGALLLMVGAFRGDFTKFNPDAVSALSIGAFAYLIVFGSLIGFSAYVWLLQVSTPARVATYAYVNPIVALLGWAIDGEAMGLRTFIAAGVIIVAVAFITMAGPGTAKKQQEKTKGAFEVIELARS